WFFMFLTGTQLSFRISWLTLLKRLWARFHIRIPAISQNTATTKTEASKTDEPIAAKTSSGGARAAVSLRLLWSIGKDFLSQKLTLPPTSTAPLPPLHTQENSNALVVDQASAAVNDALFTPHCDAPPPQEAAEVTLAIREDLRLVDNPIEEKGVDILQPFILPLGDSSQKTMDKGQVRQRILKERQAPLPAIQLLNAPKIMEGRQSAELLAAQGNTLITCLKDFDIEGELTRITPGPVVTMFEVRPAPGVRVSRIANLSDDLALSLKALSVRIEAPIPGSDTVGIEIPNEIREVVNFRELLASEAFEKKELQLPMALGKDIAGRPVAADLARMPHLLVAGATGAGKSVCLNSILLSFLYKLRPDHLQLLLVDPKRIELAVYADLPHLVHPVVTEMQQAKTALDWAVHEMDRRYESMARLGARNISGYNQKLSAYGQEKPTDVYELEHFPYLVIIIDELADLMLTAAREVETSIVRLAQLARAAGIHMILATQRPSVDVVTGLIKANFPCRISFQVTSKHDSRTILDCAGAEHLLGKGDMLFKPSGSRLQRLHAPFVSDEEVTAVVKHWRRYLQPAYKVDFSDWGDEAAENAVSSGSGSDAANDTLYPEVQSFVKDHGKASISLLQRRFRIGFNRAARIMEQLERDGIITPGDGGKPRQIIK
ncbi:MAG: FtsK/SpoIIIE domain-containing protein, partial [Betaproteobacteria bacterium]|nr:FtsK/SpoIIIE domain-containing protein [Betaproteobacteria bacterium]